MLLIFFTSAPNDYLLDLHFTVILQYILYYTKIDQLILNTL